MGQKGREQHTLRVVIILGLRKNWIFHKLMQILCPSPVWVNRGPTEETTLLGIISLIWYFKSPIGDICSIWGLVICSLTLHYQTHISPIPNWICYAQLGISDPQLGIIFTSGDNIPNWGYRLLVLYSSPVMAPTILTSAICDFLMGILVSLLGLFGTTILRNSLF